MKSNLANAGGGWRRRFGLALAAVAMVAALVVGGGLATNPQPAEAQTAMTVRWAPPSPLGNVKPGSDQYPRAEITWQGTAHGYYLKFALENAGGRATFAIGGGTTLICRDAAPASGNTPARVSACDRDKANGRVQVHVKFDADSPDGPVVLRVGLINGAPFGGVSGAQHGGALFMEVLKVAEPGSLTITPASTSISANGGVVDLTITAKNVLGGDLVTREDLLVTTNLGTIQCWTESGGNHVRGPATQRCRNFQDRTSDGTGNTGSNQSNQYDKGTQRYTLTAAGKAGVATVTVTLVNKPTLTATARIVLAGPAKTLTLAPDQSTLALSGATYIVATVTDSAGNPIKGHKIGDQAAEIAVKAPAGGSVPLSYIADKDRAKTATTPVLPACNDDGASTAVPAGTNAMGQCGIRVWAPQKGVGTFTTTASLGAHTFTVKLTATAAAAQTATVTIFVGGAPKTITTDAPARVEPLSTTTVNITVVDGDGVRVGRTDLSIDKIEGAGAIRTPTPTKTLDGRASFTYVASSEGSAVILIRAGSGGSKISKTIQVAIGDPPPVKTWSGTVVSGWNNLNWQGAEGASVAANIGSGVTAVYRWNVAAQRWDAYFPSATGVPGANDFTTLSQGASYWVFSR